MFLPVIKYKESMKTKNDINFLHISSAIDWKQILLLTFFILYMKFKHSSQSTNKIINTIGNGKLIGRKRQYEEKHVVVDIYSVGLNGAGSLRTKD